MTHRNGKMKVLHPMIDSVHSPRVIGRWKIFTIAAAAMRYSAMLIKTARLFCNCNVIKFNLGEFVRKTSSGLS